MTTTIDKPDAGPREDPGWNEYARLGTGLLISDLPLLQQRFKDEVARCRAAAAAIVAKGGRLEPATRLRIVALEAETNISGDHDPLEFATWSDQVAATCARLLELRSEFQLDPGPLRAPIRDFPPVRIHPVSDTQRAEALATGMAALDELIVVEERRLAVLRGLRRVARRVVDGADILASAQLLKRWNDGVDAIDEYRNSDQADDPANVASVQLGIVSGARLIVSGGSFTGVDAEPCAMMDEWVSSEVDKYGLAEGSEPLPT